MNKHTISSNSFDDIFKELETYLDNFKPSDVTTTLKNLINKTKKQHDKINQERIDLFKKVIELESKDKLNKDIKTLELNKDKLNKDISALGLNKDKLNKDISALGLNKDKLNKDIKTLELNMKKEREEFNLNLKKEKERADIILKKEREEFNLNLEKEREEKLKDLTSIANALNKVRTDEQIEEEINKRVAYEVKLYIASSKKDKSEKIYQNSEEAHKHRYEQLTNKINETNIKADNTLITVKDIAHTVNNNTLKVYTDANLLYDYFKQFMPESLQLEYKERKYSINNPGLMISLILYHSYPDLKCINKELMEDSIRKHKAYLEDKTINTLLFYDRLAVQSFKLIPLFEEPPTFSDTHLEIYQDIEYTLLKYWEIPRIYTDFKILCEYSAKYLAVLGENSAEYYMNEIVKFPIKYNNIPGIYFTNKINNIVNAFVILESNLDKYKDFLEENLHVKKLYDIIKSRGYKFRDISEQISLALYADLAINATQKIIPVGKYEIPIIYGTPIDIPNVSEIIIELNKPATIVEVLKNIEVFKTATGKEESSVVTENIFFVLFDLMKKLSTDKESNVSSIIDVRAENIDIEGDY